MNYSNNIKFEDKNYFYNSNSSIQINDKTIRIKPSKDLDRFISEIFHSVRIKDERGTKVINKELFTKSVIQILTDNKKISQKYKSNKKIQKILCETLLKSGLNDFSKRLNLAKQNIEVENLRLFAEEELIKSIKTLDLTNNVVCSSEVNSKKIAILNQIASIKELITVEDFFIRSSGKGKIDLKILKSNQNFIEKILHKILGLFRHREDLLTVLNLDYDSLSNEEKEIYRKAINNLKILRNLNTNFYESRSKIKNNAILRKGIVIGEAKFKNFDIAHPSFVTPSLSELIEKNRKEAFSSMASILLTDILPGEDERPFYNQGGVSFISSSLEAEICQSFENDSIPMTKEDRKNLNLYSKSIIDSFPLNALIARIGTSWPNIIPSTAEQIYKKILLLNKPEKIHLDFGYTEHGMRAVISKKSNGDIQINLFETSGGLEVIEGNLMKGVIATLFERKQRIALSIEIPEMTFREEGQAYFEQLLSLKTRMYEDVMDKNSHVVNYLSFLRVFKSIASKKKLRANHFPQKSQDCFFKRVDAAQRYYLTDLNYLRLKQRSYSVVAEHFLSHVLQILSPPHQLELKRYLENLDANVKEPTSKELKNFQKKMAKSGEIPEDIEDWKMIFKLIHLYQEGLSSLHLKDTDLLN